jgi:hypothetical protein
MFFSQVNCLSQHGDNYSSKKITKLPTKNYNTREKLLTHDF